MEKREANSEQPQDRREDDWQHPPDDEESLQFRKQVQGTLRPKERPNECRDIQDEQNDEYQKECIPTVHTGPAQNIP